MANGKLNADISTSISELRSLLKKFEIRSQIYSLILKGQGLEFYAYGDYTKDLDASEIYWKASKRANRLLTRKYQQERNMKTLFVIDVSENMVSGSTPKLKCEYTAEVAGALSSLVISSGDKFGFILFSDKVHEFVPPASGQGQFELFVNGIMKASAYKGYPDFKNLFWFILNYVDKSVSSIIIFSDFLGFDSAVKKDFEEVASQFETMLLMVRDPIDKALPDVSTEVYFEDSKTGEKLLVNPKIAKEFYRRYNEKRDLEFNGLCRKLNVDLLELATDKPFVPTLVSFLKQRVGGTR